VPHSGLKKKEINILKKRSIKNMGKGGALVMKSGLFGLPALLNFAAEKRQ
jgi:hypothetical protein